MKKILLISMCLIACLTDAVCQSGAITNKKKVPAQVPSLRDSTSQSGAVSSKKNITLPQTESTNQPEPAHPAQSQKRTPN